MAEVSSAQIMLESHRQQFPALVNKAYFNYGGQGPLAQAALEAIFRSYEYIQNIGPFSNEINDWILQEAQQTREAIATELNVDAGTITLTENVSVGCNIALWGIDWKPGDRLLISDCEHPSIIATVQELQRRFNIEVSMCQLMETLNEGDPVGAITQHLYHNTKLIVLSHILWNTGQVLPLAKINRACKNLIPTAKILVDAAQSVGVLPLNLDELGIDFYAFTGHKWWCGPEGLGGLYVRNPEEMHPTFIGWRGMISTEFGQPVNWKPDARRYEVATSAYPLYAGLRTAIALHHQCGSQSERYQQIQYLSEYLWQRLNNIRNIICLRTSPPEASLVSFQLANKRHPQLVQSLEKQGLLVRTIKNPDCVRACVHYFTLTSEIDRLIESIESFC